MTIVVLDGFTLNPGDLNWQPLEELGECRVYDRSSPAEVAPRAHDAPVVLTNKTLLDQAALAQLPKLTYIGVLATGYNVVDLAAARRRGIVVTNVPAYGTSSVAQMTIALLLELTQHIGHHADTVRSGRWCRSPDFCYWDYPLVELDGQVLGLVGFGRIARAVARIAQALGMKVLVSSRTQPANLPAGVTWTDLDQLLRDSDVVSLHCPLTEETRGLINPERLSRMKPSAFLINTGRGPLVNETALAEALNTGRLAGAGLDVLTTEPPPVDNPLLTAKNCVITPHIAWATAAARSRLLRIAVDNVRAFLQGRPQNVVC